jgi:hypothetical protein
MAKSTVNVADFLTNLQHPQKAGILQLRKAILAADSAITERIKWNAPSFCYHDDDRVTFRLPPNKPGLQLIFHRGAKTKDATGFSFDDPSGLIEWAAADRGIVTLSSDADIASNIEKVVKLVRAWCQATDDTAAAPTPTTKARKAAAPKRKTGAS